MIFVTLINLAWRGQLPVQVIERQLLDSRDAIENLVNLYGVIFGVASLDTGAVSSPVAIARVSGETVQEINTGRGRVQSLPEPKPSPEAVVPLNLPSPTSASPTRAPAAEPVISIQAVVQAANINVRSGPATSYSVVNIGRAGMTYAVIARDGPGDWLRVADTRESWIAADLLDVQGGADAIARLPITASQVVRVEATPTSYAVVKSVPINVRAGPGTTFEVVDVAASGSAFGVTTRDRTGDWYRLVGESERWVAAAVIEVKDPPPAATMLPVPSSPVPSATIRVMPTATMETVSTTVVPTVPQPVMVMTPSPTATRVPTYTPTSALVTATPAALDTATPAALDTATPAALATATPAALATATPAPLATATPAPLATATSAPRPLITPPPYIVVKANRLNVRSGPATAFGSVGVVLAGDTSAIVGRTADGAWFRLAGDTERWVSSDLVAVMGGAPPVVAVPNQPALPTAVPTPFVVVNADQVNIRSGPDIIYNVVGTASKGASYAVVERSEAGDWYRLAGDQERWVSAALLQLTGNPPFRTSTALAKAASDVPSRDSVIAPILVKPIDGFTLWPFNEATFQWRWTGRPLAANQGFEVRLWVDNSPEHFGVARPVPFVPNPDHVYTLYVGSVRTAPGIVKRGTGDDWVTLWWTVAVVQITPYAPIGPEAKPFRMPTQLK